MTVKPSVRFEVFKRDSFTCQYCGAKAPDVVLEVDHIEPVSKGGADEVLNLVTSCWPCNRGKSDRRLDDNTVVARQREQLAELNERHQQLSAMLEWRNELAGLSDREAISIIEAFATSTGWRVVDGERRNASKWVREFGVAEMLAAVDVVATNYPTATSQEAGEAWRKLPRVAHQRRAGDSEVARASGYVRGILRNRCHHVPFNAMAILVPIARRVPFETMRAVACSVTSWTDFVEAFEGDQ